MCVSVNTCAYTCTHVYARERNKFVGFKTISIFAKTKHMEKFDTKDMKHNGWTETTVPDLKVGNTILFDTEDTTQQGHTVTSIFDNGDNDIIVCHIPEWTPTRSFSMFKYGKRNFRLKK